MILQPFSGEINIGIVIAVANALTKNEIFSTYFLGERNSYLNSFDWTGIRKVIYALLEKI
jgi:hypothetical protein